MAKIRISPKSKRVYNLLNQLDVVKNVKENIIKDHKHWQTILDGIYYEVYNDKNWFNWTAKSIPSMQWVYQVYMGSYRGWRHGRLWYP